MNAFKFNDVKEFNSNRFADSPLGKEFNSNRFVDPLIGKQYPFSEHVEIKFDILPNKLDGCAREEKVEKELQEKYPPEKGYSIIREAYLRDENGNIVKDPVT